MKKLIGLSLSFCIKDICENRIPIESVEAIVPNLVISENNTLEDVFNRYKEVYWKDYPEKAWEAINRIKLLPRHPNGVNIAQGHWMAAEDYDTSLVLNYVQSGDPDYVFGVTPAPQDQELNNHLKMRCEQAWEYCSQAVTT